MEDADHPGRTLVGGLGEAQAVGQVRVGAAPGDGQRPAVGAHADHRPQGHHRFRTAAPRRFGQGSAECGPPEVRLDAGHHHDIAPSRRGVDGHQRVAGPGQSANPFGVEADHRALLGEIEERLWVDLAEFLVVVALHQPFNRCGG